MASIAMMLHGHWHWHSTEPWLVHTFTIYSVNK